jgi:hypothetical protein
VVSRYLPGVGGNLQDRAFTHVSFSGEGSAADACLPDGPHAVLRGDPAADSHLPSW